MIKFLHSLILLSIISFSIKVNAQVSFTSGLGLSYAQNFDSLSVVSTPASLIPLGWFLGESGSNANTTYVVDSGVVSSGNTYSYGRKNGTDRALGELSSGSLQSSFGTFFINNTDSEIVGIQISYFLEQWRRGTTAVIDSIRFEYSNNATTLNNGIWQSFSTLNAYSIINTGAASLLNGNLSANRVLINAQLTGISIPIGDSLWIRFKAFDVAGGDNGLAIDNFTATAIKGVPVILPASIEMVGIEKTVSEIDSLVSIQLNISGANSLASNIIVSVSAMSNLNSLDVTLLEDTISFLPNSSISQQIKFTINNDVIPEATEYLLFTIRADVNAIIPGNKKFILYVKDNDSPIPEANNEVVLNYVTSFMNDSANNNSAEISAYDPTTKLMYIANSIGKKIDIVNFSNLNSLSLYKRLDISSYGNVNSVAVKNGILAIAIENDSTAQDSGFVLLTDSSGVIAKQLTVGAMPDMIVFNNAGTKIYTANEGQPNETYIIDPDGSISVIDISAGVATATVSQIGFSSFNGQEATLKSQGVRIFGVSGIASKDFEPEYITISDDDKKAYVTLQENNAIVTIDLINNSVLAIKSLGYKNHNLPNNALDVSDVTTDINIANWPVLGMYMPDAIANFKVGSNNFLITANEGDAREYGTFLEPVAVSTLNLDPTNFPNASDLKLNTALGKLKVSNKSGDTDGDGDFDSLFVFGSRSFSIWDSTGALVYDSGKDFETYIANSPQWNTYFNASNGLPIVKKNRSDDKGPEPEGVVIGKIANKNYAFIALERIGGVMVYNVDNPLAPKFEGYYNNRPLTGLADRGAEGIIFIPAINSPNNKDLIVMSNETSSTISVFEVNTCQSTLYSNVLFNVLDTTLCFGDSTSINLIGGNAINNSYAWYNANTLLANDSLSFIAVKQSGNYKCIISSSYGCKDTTTAININVLPQYTPLISFTGNDTICEDNTITLSVNPTAGLNYVWLENLQQIANSDSSLYVVSESNIYTVVTNQFGCIDTAVSISLAILDNPEVEIEITDSVLCSNQTAILQINDFDNDLTYNWYNNTTALSGTTDSTTTISAAGNYFVIASNNFGCKDTSNTATVIQYAASFAPIGFLNDSICSGDSVILVASNQSNLTYQWFANGSLLSTNTNDSLMVNASGNYYYVATINNQCKDTSSNTIIAVLSILSTPIITIQSDTLLTNSLGPLYQWYLDGIAILGANNSSYIINATGLYTLKVSNTLNCNSAVSNIINYIVVSNKERQFTNSKVEVFPNPFESNINLTIVDKLSTSCKIEIQDLYGKIVFKTVLQNQKNNLNLETLSSGTYILKLVNESTTYTSRIVKL